MNELDLKSVIFGAVLAIIGGSIVEFIKVWIEENRELRFMKSSFKDELDEIKSIIDKLSETWDKTHLIHKAYIDDLLVNTEVYKNYKLRLYLFRSADFRKKLSAFYRGLERMIKENEGKIGTLADTAESIAEQQKIKDRLVQIGHEASNLASSC